MGEWETKERALFGEMWAWGKEGFDFLEARDARGAGRRGNFSEGEAESWRVKAL